MDVHHRFGAEVADAGLCVQPAVRLDDDQTVESVRAGEERAHADADAAHLRSDALLALRLALVPTEELGALVERLL